MCFHLSQLAYVIQHLDHAATVAPSDVRVRPRPSASSVPFLALFIHRWIRGRQHASFRQTGDRNNKAAIWARLEEGRKEALKPRRGQRIEPFDVGGRPRPEDATGPRRKMRSEVLHYCS